MEPLDPKPRLADCVGLKGVWRTKAGDLRVQVGGPYHWRTQAGTTVDVPESARYIAKTKGVVKRAHGPTPRQALANLLERFDESTWEPIDDGTRELLGMKRGRPPRVPGAVQTNVTVGFVAAELAALEQHARAHGQTRTEFIRATLERAHVLLPPVIASALAASTASPAPRARRTPRP